MKPGAKKKGPTVVIVAIIIAIAVLSVPKLMQHSGDDGHGHEDGLYACPMLCVPPSEKPGKCPVCGMALEPVDGSADDAGKPVIALSERSRALSRVETAAVERRPAAVDVRLSGAIKPDETTMRRVAARVRGRIDRLYADFTGKTIRQGDPLMTLYSPELISAQEELLQSLRSGPKETILSAREKLRLLGVSPEQIQGIEKKGVAEDHMDFLSPFSGIVVTKNAVEGSYISEGTELFSIADLTTVWAMLDAYESDLPLLREGQKVELTAESLPGERFESEISFIDPVLDEMARVAGVRVIVKNDGLRLKPGMLVRATAQANLDARGNAVATDAQPGELPLLVPASAPLLTGKRAVVYVATGEPGEYEGRVVRLGPRAGDSYVVLDGLAEGDRVVVQGNFRIDSALQIMGRPSMMVPGDDAKETPDETTGTETPQTKCPIMGGAINKDVYIDYKGYRIYFCCPGCDGPFMKDPEKYIEQMRSEGVILDKTPTAD